MKLVKVPYSQGSLGKIGSEKAPDLILERLKNLDNIEIDSIEIIKDNIDKNIKNIAAKEGDIFIGGDHSITYSLFRSFSKKFKNPGLILFDAHPDCEVCTKSVSHEDFLRKLVEEGILKRENVVLIGIRKWSKNEFLFLKENKIKYFSTTQLFNNHENVCDTIMEMANKFDSLYISMDIDVVDPSMAPGTNYKEPAGLTSAELLYFIQRLKHLKNLKRVDLVEINPKKDINGITISLAAKILGELL